MRTAVADGLAPEDVLATEEMLARPRKAADLAAEVAAFRELSALMAVDRRGSSSASSNSRSCCAARAPRA